ncbi:MAG: transcription-repair coupling factor [Rothia sp. (in: high G+C Gram-positive bacteria)]|uniref:transcription-repair coupling factor n=1 Tax=Rothia sp. (in: high G+C Gram-positive bacteria) TaxID=1885016 RepID=UPI0026DF14A3|nr:transcription-repair coupling factor [Rothia sp. (in: high G+C Gram-positive bacteria)]MDO5750326.1 transcription-repair coupling factor [Rothia sp. (in: high G+C Gram-positive bacteria)]
MEAISRVVRSNPRYAAVVDAASRSAAQRSSRALIGAVAGVQAPLLADISSALDQRETLFVIAPTERQAEDMAHALRAFLPAEDIALFPAWETLPHERLSPRSDTVGARLQVLHALTHDDQHTPRVVIAPVRAAIQPLVAGIENLEPVHLVRGEEYEYKAVIRALNAAAYSRVDLVAKRGEYAVRGGIIDVFSPTARYPVRLEFFGDELDEIRLFSPSDQRALGADAPHPSEVTLLPCRELLITPQVQSAAARFRDEYPAYSSMLEKIAGGIYVEGMESLIPLLAPRLNSVLSLLPSGSLVMVAEPERVAARAEDLWATNREFLNAAWATSAENEEAVTPVDMPVADAGFRELSAIRSEAAELGLGWWELSELVTDESLIADALEDGVDSFSIPAQAAPSYTGSTESMLVDIGALVRDGWSVLIATNGAGSVARLAELFQQAQVPAASFRGELQPGLVELAQAPARAGFRMEQQRLALFTEAEVLGRRGTYAPRGSAPKLKPRRRRAAVDPLALNPGDYVVHERHGIGRFVQMESRPVPGASPLAKDAPSREYLVIEYAPSKRGGAPDRLFVPSDQLDLISHYVGSDTPALSKMGGSDWSKAKSRARKAVRDIAADLVKLYSARQASRGHAFSEDTPWQRELEESFPYNETPDQLNAIYEVKADMEREVPMDRLISGDVGFGKTEVAVRAAFKAIQDGKQVAVLVPTTLLAQQHFETFTERFSGFPVRVKVLSRFQKAKETRQITEEIAAGTVDVVIGTHRILSDSVQFKDLGLVIIDEEQRFGVEHKEKLKKLRTNVDVLAMSATPIPRTLEMSLTGIRETSTLATAPEERHPVLTYVGPRTDNQIIAAIRRELMREGQVFFVHNRVADIDDVAAEIGRLVPEARIATAHGKMSESRLEQIIVDFWERRFDVLVCTTIVETGLDISNANTLIVDQAQNYGLSQLHQLRGRVGRGRERAYAYFLYPAGKMLGEVAHERLKAVATHNELGAGLQLAMKDLEIRGAGNLLGGEQSGHIAGVGFDLYLRMVGEAVSAFRGEYTERIREVKVDLPVNAHIPHSYIDSERLRLQAYRQIASADTPAKLQEAREELTDRYGALPEPVENLLRVSALRQLASSAGIQEIMLMGPKVRVVTDAPLAESRVMRLERVYPGATHTQPKGMSTWVTLLPRPKTLPVGGRELVDAEILLWAAKMINSIFTAEPKSLAELSLEAPGAAS